MTVRLLASLPDKIHNGLVDLPSPELGREYLIVARVRLARHEVIDDGDASDNVWKLSLEHVELVPADDEPDVSAVLAETFEERRANGQLSFDDDVTDAGEIPELLAEIRELTDDNPGITEAGLAERFEAHYGVPPKGCGNAVWLREFIHAVREDLKLPPRTGTPAAGDDAEVVHTSSTPDADA